MFRISLPTLLPACVLALGATSHAQGNALQFDGVDDFAIVTDNAGDFDLADSLTVETWIRADDPAAFNTAFSTNGLALVADNTDARFFAVVPGLNSVTSPGLVPGGEWTHLAGTYDGNLLRIYVNGLLAGTVSVPGTTTVTPIFVLGRFNNTFGHLNGALDETRVWNYVRTSTQIAATYDRELTGQEPGLVAYYQYEGTGQTLVDSAGNNDGTLGDSSAIEATDPVRTPSGAPIRPKGVEGALLFDGSDDIAVINGSFDFTTDQATLETWFRVDDGGSTGHPLMRMGLFASLSLDNSMFGSTVNAFACDGIARFSFVPDQEWTHVAATCDGSVLRIYINGQLEDSSPATDPGSVLSVLELGSRPPGGFPRTLNGRLDEVRVWNVARSGAEIEATFGTELRGNEAGLIGYYKFNEPNGQEILDSSVAGNHGFLGVSSAVESTDPQRVASSLAMNPNDAGGALLFDGVEDIARVNDIYNYLDLGEECTFEAWARFDSLTGVQSVVASFGAGLQTVGSTGIFFTQTPTLASALGTVSSGVWTHLAGTYDGSTVSYYINGQLAGTTVQSGPTNDASRLWLGRLNATGQFMHGAIDEVRVWNTVRTASEIAETMVCPPQGPQAGLVAYYKFDEPFGQVIRDSSGFCNDGFLGLTDMTGTDDAVRIVSDAPICPIPDNDDCADAIDVSAGGQFSGTIIGANNDGTASCGESSTAPDVWYSYTATEIGVLEVTTCGTHDMGGVDSGMDTVLTLFDGCNGAELVCNDDFLGCSPADAQGADRDSQVMVSLLPGQTVLVRVSYYNLAGSSAQSFPGPFALNVSFDSGGFVNLCNGDGGDQMGCTDCTCGNNAPAGTIGGCINQAGNSAQLIPGNSASVSAVDPADLSFIMTGGNPGTFAILLSGNNLAPQNAANPCFGLGSGLMGGSALDGLRCAVGGVQRHGGRPMDVNGDVGFTTNGWGGSFGPPAGIAAQSGFVPGQTRYFQVFYRALTTQGCGTGQNSSQAVGVTFQP